MFERDRVTDENLDEKEEERTRQRGWEKKKNWVSETERLKRVEKYVISVPTQGQSLASALASIWP